MAKRLHSTPWIKIGDFEQTTYWVSIHNVMTKTVLKNSKDIELTEVSEQGLTLRLPRTACAMGHQLLVRIQKKIMQPLGDEPGERLADEIKMTAKVAALEPFDPLSNTVEIRFYQYNLQHWQLFLREYAERQEKADAVLRAIQE